MTSILNESNGPQGIKAFISIKSKNDNIRNAIASGIQ